MQSKKMLSAGIVAPMAISVLGMGMSMASAKNNNAKAEDDHPAFVGSIVIANLATITKAQANASATSAVKDGKVLDIELEAQNGYLVYNVHVENKTGAYEVIVDAGGKGAVLAISLAENVNQKQNNDKAKADKDDGEREDEGDS